MTKKSLLKWALIVFGASILMVAVGGYGLYRAFEIPLEAIVVLENKTESPVEDVRLTYGGEVLFRDPSFESIAVLAYLRPEEEETPIELTFRRAGDNEMETYPFVARQGEYFERCAFFIWIKPDGAQMRGCFEIGFERELIDSRSDQKWSKRR